MPDAKEQPPLQLADIWPMLRRRRIIAAVAAVAVFALVLAAPGFLVPPMHRAEATLATSRGLKPVNMQSDPLSGLVPDQLVNTQCELLTSEDVLRDALSMGGLHGNPVYARSADPFALLQRRLHAAVVKNSWVITVSLDDEDSMQAENGLQAVLDAFLAHQTTVSRIQSDRDLAFIAAQITEAERKLDLTREAERLFRSQNGIASTDPDRNHITARIQNLAERQAALDERVAASAALLRQVQAADGIEDRQQRLAAYLRIDTISSLTVVGALQTDLYKLQGEEAELMTKYLDKHPKLIEVRSHIATKRAQLEENIAASRAAIESDNRLLTEQRAGLVQAQHDLQAELNGYRDRLVQLQRLSQATQAQQKVFDELVARQAQAMVMSGYDDRRMALEGRPRASPVARGIGLIPLAALGLVMAIGAAVAAAALADSLDRNVQRPQQVREATGLHVLGTVPCIPGLQPLCVTGPADPPALAESMLALWTALRYALGPAPGCRVLVVVSADAGDGRSILASRLAAGIAMSGSRILLVDGDLRQPTLAAQFGTSSPVGLAQILLGEPDQTPVATGIPNLDLMPAGQVPGNPGELLNSHCLAEWIAHVRGFYDVVVIDSPALAECADATVLADQADALAVAVRLGGTGSAALAAMWERLAPLKAKAVGCVLISSETSA